MRIDGYITRLGDQYFLSVLEPVFDDEEVEAEWAAGAVQVPPQESFALAHKEVVKVAFKIFYSLDQN